MDKEKVYNWLSNCCNAPVIVDTADEGTSHFVCSKCDNACDSKIIMEISQHRDRMDEPTSPKQQEKEMTQLDQLKAKAVEEFDRLFISQQGVVGKYIELTMNSAPEVKSFLLSQIEAAYAAGLKENQLYRQQGHEVGFKAGQTALRDRLVEAVKGIKRQSGPVSDHGEGYNDACDNILALLQTSVKDSQK